MTEETQFPEGLKERVAAAGGEFLPAQPDGIPTARVEAGALLDLLGALKTGPGLRYEMLTDVFGIDEYPQTPRFDLVYHLRALSTGEMVRIRAFAQGDDHKIPSVVGLFGTADWHEREAYDMMGIDFTGHPDLKRILMPLEYEHHPLRKDFPLEGIEPEKLFKKRFPGESSGSMHQKPQRKGQGGS